MNRVSLRGWVCGGVILLFTWEAALAQAVYFRRGDANSDSKVDVSDAIAALNFLFIGGAALPCLDAADANDDGRLDISDAVFDLAFLFLGGPAPPAPGPDTCGYESTTDELYCAKYLPCWQPVIFFEVIDGYAVTEGDISLGRPEDVPLNVIGLGRGGAFGVEEGGDSLFGDLWPNGFVPFTVDSGVNQTLVTNSIAHWEARTSIRFFPRTDERNFVRFRALSGCHSRVGMVGGEQVISLGSGCSTGNAIHEIGHAIGLFHEQARSDRDNFITVHYENVQDGMAGQFDERDGVVYCSPYDYGSIMHYGTHFFSKNSMATIETIPPGIPIGQRTALSDFDIQFVEHRYAASPFYSNWSPMGGSFKGSPGVGSNEDGRLEIFVVGDDDAVWQRWQVAPNSSWSDWNSLEGTVMGNPAVGSNQDGRLEIFVRATDSSVWQRWQVAPNGDWSDWNPMGFGSKSDLTVVRNLDGRLELFFVGFDDAVWHLWQVEPNSFWSGGESLSGTVIGTPAVGMNADGRLEVYQRATDGNVYQIWQVPGGGWSGWHPTGLVAKSNIGVGRNADGRLEIFAVGMDDALWHTYQLAPNSTWSAWESLAGDCLPDDPAVGLNTNGLLEVFVRGFDTGIWHSWQHPLGGWTGWRSLLGQVVDNVRIGTNEDGRLEMFGRATDNSLYQKWQMRCDP